MKNVLCFLFVSLFYLASCQNKSSADSLIPSAPATLKFINNFSTEFPDFLSSSETEKLEKRLLSFSKKTSAQIVVVIVDDLGKDSPGEFAMKLGNKWGVGDKEKDNGVIILIKPTGGAGERQTFIAVGLGIEEIITDQKAKEIVEKELLPNFKSAQFYKGIDNAISSLIKLLS